MLQLTNCKVPIDDFIVIVVIFTMPVQQPTRDTLTLPILSIISTLLTHLWLFKLCTLSHLYLIFSTLFLNNSLFSIQNFPKLAVITEMTSASQNLPPQSSMRDAEAVCRCYEEFSKIVSANYKPITPTFSTKRWFYIFNTTLRLL